jgi:hypothetical protein
VLKISKVKESSQSQIKGIKVDDLIYDVNGKEIKSEYHFAAIVEEAKSSSEPVKMVVFRGHTPSVIYFDSSFPIGIQYAQSEKDKYYKYKLDVNFVDAIIFLIVWVMLLVVNIGIATLGITFDIATPCFIFYCVWFIVNHTEKHLKNN